ncbi:hypothetical protein NDU88_003907 [Pleurodeles waltl]|uniref:Uncharacterized protein n=1 Tax=Pleurodeles waltl TaxID=8319 RepID=A0AAV7V373_PLEWA|nr:hypothetical protein NDU88_003907 [Pleurodeles waltl]
MARQLHFSEALQHSRPTTEGPPLMALPHTTARLEQETNTKRILQEITAVGQRIKRMDFAISSLMPETKSMRLDIGNFQSRVSGLEQHVTIMEDHLNTGQDRDQELLYLLSKLVDLEDRSRGDSVCFFGFPEHLEGTDTQTFLRKVLPTLTNQTSDPPMEFQRAHKLGPKRKEGDLRPRMIIACILCHGQVRQLLLAARSQGPFRV